jgi:glucose-1-phosphate cytidylyltransferase
MKTVILAGGLGTRLAEETTVRPKPMVEIGGRPILWHIMNIYAAAGFEDFVVALGYKGEFVKQYFLNFYALNNDVSLDLRRGFTTVHDGRQPAWRVDLIDTGVRTQTGGRIKRLRPWLGNETFLATYGDGLADIDIGALVQFHRRHGRLATVTAVHPPSRFGEIVLDGQQVVRFAEKPQIVAEWISGGFFVFEPAIFDYIRDDETPLEREPLERLAGEGQLAAYRHEGFWQAMDTLREKQTLEQLWESGAAPWKAANLARPSNDELQEPPGADVVKLHNAIGGTNALHKAA